MDRAWKCVASSQPCIDSRETLQASLVRGASWHTADEVSRQALKTTSQVDRRNALSLRLKRTLDLVGSTTLLLVTWPLFLVIALAIKLDSPGPVYFRRRVAGQYGKLFGALKFGSMVAEAL